MTTLDILDIRKRLSLFTGDYWYARDVADLLAEVERLRDALNRELWKRSG